MSKKTVCLFVLGLSFVAAPLAVPARDSEHPIIGTWTWTPEGKNCKEVYEWRANHTGHVTSGEEVTETRFTVSAKPDRHGFYKFVDEVVKDNRGKDCADSTKDNTGEKVTYYIQIHPSGDQIRICLKPSENSCFGPLMRLPELET